MQVITDDVRKFLLEGGRTAQLATVRADGRPHVAPIWFDVDGNTIVFTTGQTSVKGRNMRRDGRVCLCVDDERPPFAYVQIEGTASLSDDMGELKRWATRLGGRYMGAEQAEAYGKRNAVQGELLVRVTPTKIVFQRDIAS
ncbi:MAG: PPOX class F420-dependent oxidoreductase [Ktedonobacteraceae bacterium]|nr:PPOX class F420-dependent oxidoreductase [Ktedonobacteraceae bacterium]MBO0793238.1 PPOX class F420-dependent oxidoreductase [Ktedonobacteraceae bacterium]